MRLKVMQPSEVIVDRQVEKISAEAANGAFTLLPRHQDFVAALVPGLLSFVDADGREEFMAVDEGVLVKYGAEVLVSSLNVVRGPDLGMLKETVRNEFLERDERQKVAMTAMARLEASFVRKYIDLGKSRI